MTDAISPLHNQPPSALPLDERARQEIAEALTRAKARWAELEASYGRAPKAIENEERAEDVTTLIAQIGAMLNAADRAHADAKAPWLEASRAIDGVANRLREPAIEAKKDLQARLTAYQTAKAKRIEDERKAQRQGFEAAGDPEPSWSGAPVPRARVAVRSLEGASAHLQSDIEVEIFAVKRIPKKYLDRPKVQEALKAELKPDLKKGDKIPGTKAVEVTVSRVRRG